MSSHDDVYDGPFAASTVARTSVWCGGCRAFFAGRYQHAVDGDADEQVVQALLRGGYAACNRVTCPKCDWAYTIEAPFTVHRASRRQFLLVIPEAARHRALQIKAARLREVAETLESGVLPSYITQPTLVAGLSELAEHFGAPPVVSVQRSPAPAEPLTPDDSLPFDVAPFGTPGPEVPALASPAGPPGAEPTLPTPAPDPEPAAASDEISLDIVSVDIEAEAPKDRSLLAQVAKKRVEERPPAPPPPERDTDRWSALDEGWTLTPAPDEGSPEEPTQMVRVPPVATPEVATPTFDADRALGRDGYVLAQADLVQACVQLDAERAAGFVDGTARVRFQLHEPAPGPVMMLVLERTQQTGEPVDHAAWVLSPKLDRDALDVLAETFTVEFQLFDSDGAYVGRRRLRAPLEANVREAREWVQAAQSRSDFAKASKAVTAADYDRLGQLRHNFEVDSFSDLASAADARLALGITSYWSAPERRDYLLRIQSFPRDWYDGLLQRVVTGAVEYGLGMEPHMRQAAIDAGVASDSRDLLKRTLANFAEVNLNLKPSGLDPLDIWDNWEALLAYAEELDVRVDADIEELAAQAMERAREAAQQETFELDADDGSVELEELTDFSELSDVDLVSLLDDPKNRLDAALALLGRGRNIHVPALFDTIRVMNRGELLRMVPAALAMGPAFESSFVEGLNSRRAALRLASALFLAEIRSERAVAPLLALIPPADEAAWPILARAAARMGRRIVSPALELVVAEGDPGGRLAEALALLGPDARPALAAAREQRNDAPSRACLDRALDRVGEVSFADAADFTERLDEAFAAAGDEELGPDFEESIVSVELGPGSSVSDLEADVDFGSLEDD